MMNLTKKERDKIWEIANAYQVKAMVNYAESRKFLNEVGGEINKKWRDETIREWEELQQIKNKMEVENGTESST